MLITKKSGLTGKISNREIDITEQDYAAYLSGRHNLLIQDMFPHLSQDDREFMMTGITPEEWELAFGGAEEDNYVPLIVGAEVQEDQPDQI